MASGIKVHDDIKKLGEAMKVQKSGDDANKRLRLVTFAIKDDSIEVDKQFCECDLCGTDAYTMFRGLLLETDCFYFLYDCHYVNDEGIPKEEMIFGSWIPEGMTIKQKMLYASSREAIKKVFKGVKHDVQINDFDDIQTRTGFAGKINMPTILSIEGKPLK